jgi:hypothetical protein
VVVVVVVVVGVDEGGDGETLRDQLETRRPKLRGIKRMQIRVRKRIIIGEIRERRRWLGAVSLAED